MDNLTIDYNQSEQFLQIVIIGDIVISDHLKLLKLLENFPTEYSSNIRLLCDRRQATAKYTHKELFITMKPFLQIVNKFHYLKIAELVANPNDTALAVLFQQDVGFLSNLEFKLFSTKEAALEWLNVNQIQTTLLC